MTNLYHRGESFLRLQNYSLATEDFSKAIDNEHEAPAIYNARGMSYKGLGLYKEAIADLSVGIIKSYLLFCF